MSIFYDPTESRQNTKLHPRIIEAGTPVIGLESVTGADLLISPKAGKIPTGNVMRPPGSVVFKSFVESGFLIQRKSGGDLLGSIQEPGLLSILVRMQEHPASCWLMVVGDYQRSADSKTIVNGRSTGFHWHGYRGGLEAWQLSGGLTSEWKTEDEAADWILRWDKNMAKMESSVYHVRPRHIAVHLQHDPRPWREVLEAFPGVGSNLSEAIADYCGSLGWALSWMSFQEETGLAGVGIKKKLEWNKFMGLDDDEILMRMHRDDPLVMEIRKHATQQETRLAVV